MASVLPITSSPAMEAVTNPNNRASNAAVVRLLAAERAEQLAELAALETQVNAILRCTYKGRFYAPGMNDADADGCTSIEVTVIH